MEHMVDGLKSNDSEANVILFSAHLIISSISPSILWTYKNYTSYYFCSFGLPLFLLSQ